MRVKLFAEFRKFVMEQPDERLVLHGDWCGCAVGDFQKESKREENPVVLASRMQYTSHTRRRESDAPYWVLEILNRMGKIHLVERNCLDSKYAPYFEHLKMHKVPSPINTYGKLKHLIQVTEEYFA